MTTVISSAKNTWCILLFYVDSKRAIETAELILSANSNFKIELPKSIETWPLLRERHFGALEGEKVNVFRKLAEKSGMKDSSKFWFLDFKKGSETVEELDNRANDFVTVSKITEWNWILTTLDKRMTLI